MFVTCVMKTTIHVSIGNSRSRTIEKKTEKSFFLPWEKESLLVLSYLRSTYPEEQQCGHFCQKSFKVISGLRNTDLMTFPFSSNNRKRRVPKKISCKFFGMFHKTLTFFGGRANFLTDVVRVSFQSTKKTCETVFPEQFPKIATYLGHIEQKKFDVFLTNFSTIKKNSLSNLFLKNS